MRFVFILFLFATSYSYGQLVGGTLVTEGREMTSETSFVQEGTIDGWAIYELSVNRDGKVTGARIVETNLNRTTAKMQIRNYLMKFKFTAGTHYPAFQHVQVKITLVKPVSPESESSDD